MDAFRRVSRFGSLMLRARALGVALLIAGVGFGGGTGVAFVHAWWKDILSLAEKHAGLGGWIGAVVITPVAIFITLAIATWQTRAERNARRSQRE
jgi:hypothetical protein